MDSVSAGSALNKVLNPAIVSTRGGAMDHQTIYYLPIHTARALANDIFGTGNWDVVERSFEVDYDRNAATNDFKVEVSCCVRVSLRSGSFREDVGFGEAVGAFRGDVERQARAIAKADATKRCLRAFGNTLGNCLYYREYAKFAQSKSLAS